MDVEQLAFELDASMELGNYLYVLYREPEMLQRARAAGDDVVGSGDAGRARDWRGGRIRATG